MLTQDALEAAIPLSQLAFSKKTTLSAIPNTPLAALMNATCLPEASELAAQIIDGEQSVDLGLIANRTNSAFPNTDYVEHNEVFDDVVRVAAESLKKQISFAKTVVSPIIQDIVEKTKAALNSGSASKLSHYRVEPYIFPAPIFNASFDSLVQQSAGNNPNFDMPPLLAFPMLPVEEIAKLVETGASNIDKDVANWIATTGTDFLVSTWRNFFSNEKSMSATNLTLANAFARPAVNSFEPSGYDFAVAVFLIASHLSDEPVAGSNLGTADLESYLKGYREVAARAIIAAMTEADMASKNGVLVRGRNEFTVSVNNHVYTEWLKGEQNCAEALLGILLENRTLIFVDDINGNRDRLCDNWERHVRLVKASEQAEEHVQIRGLFINYFNAYFKGQLAENPEFATQVYASCKNFEMELMKFSSDEMRSLWVPVTKAVCRAAYPASSAEEILLGMEEASKVNPDADPRELAAIVVVDMAAKWLAQQIQVTG